MGTNKSNFKYSFIKVLTGSDLSNRRLPFMQTWGENKGPTIWITACSHGDEVGGVVLVQEVFHHIKKNKLLKGIINSFPLMNPIGFENISRNISLTKEDLNRCFPGNTMGTLAERMAYLIYSNIIETKPDLVIDIHNDWQKSIPYILLDKESPGIDNNIYNKTIEIAKKSGFILIKDHESIRNSLSCSLLHNSIPSFTLELGESYVVNEKNIKMGTRSILQILEYFGMIKNINPPFKYDLPGYDNILLDYNEKPLCSKSGIIRFNIKPGDIIKKGHTVAKIYNAFGKQLESIKPPYDAIILGHRDSSVAFPGTSLIAYGIINN